VRGKPSAFTLAAWGVVTASGTDDLRHTYATLQLAAGTSPKLVAEVLGHKDVDITLNRYSHSLPTMHREAAERLDAILGRGAG
jgi:integrase